ncbi:AIPR family protein [Streptomyces sp. NBC_01142]|uniref:AIPR family protein n=1 Tax=Streptomyces sp. NBC_01142 TaxID=2975865 RepID=UPI002259D36B|nr:AIPR family protein [Streptomyces sp. NBC_01142]MCX4825570.1 AIPR family protein [Streptomyces sp. NBC_01142]
MGSDMRAEKSTPLEVRHIRDALAREFTDLIDMSDHAHREPTALDTAFLSRATAAKTVRILTGCGPEEAAEAVIDGRDDLGIDAVAFSLAVPELWLIQAKWSHQGTAQLTPDGARRLVEGMRKLAEREFDRFNVRFQRLANRVDDVLTSPRCKMHLVVAVMGDGRASREAESLLLDGMAEFGAMGDVVDVRFLNTADFHSAVRQDMAPTPISVSATMAAGWHSFSTPYPAFDGAVTADELARWYQEHGEALYERNVRRSLGLTKVNQALVTSLLKNPQEFWYYNNGITVLCDSIRTEFFARRAEGQPVRLQLSNARVVNGAQTVTSAYRAFEQNPDAVAEAYVPVRVISVEDAPEGLAARITETTNTQNHMEARDFIALDANQALIREDFALSLGKRYVYKRGELVPSPAVGCSVVEAATALACAHPDASLVVRVRGDKEFLWHEAPYGAYTQLFARRPGACQIWRSVQLLRTVSEALHEMAASLPGRARAIADSGSLLVAHILFQTVGNEGIEEPDSDWEAGLGTVLERVGEILSLLISLVDRLYGPHIFVSSTFTDERKCRELVEGVMRGLAGVADALELAPQRQHVQVEAPRPQRRPSSVKLLVEHGRIADGTRLMYRPSAAEERAVGEWLNADPSRFLATWVNDPRRPLIWAADRQRYSPSSLVMHIWRSAEWDEAPVAVQGVRYWALPDEGTLVELAEEIWRTMRMGDSTGAV